jgi:hypothetical protein
MAKFVGKTVKFVEGTASKLQVPEGATDAQIFDSTLRGFGMRRFAPSKQFPKGKVSYFVKFTIAGKQRRVTLGEVIDGNLKSMRLQAFGDPFQGKVGARHGGRGRSKSCHR